MPRTDHQNRGGIDDQESHDCHSRGRWLARGLWDDCRASLCLGGVRHIEEAYLYREREEDRLGKSAHLYPGRGERSRWKVSRLSGRRRSAESAVPKRHSTRFVETGHDRYLHQLQSQQKPSLTECQWPADTSGRKAVPVGNAGRQLTQWAEPR